MTTEAFFDLIWPTALTPCVEIRVLSDLHYEFKEFELPICSADLTIFAGDTDRGIQAVHRAAALSPKTPAILVLGNHEYYKRRFERLPEEFREAAVGTNVLVLDDEVAIVAGIRVLGATLWTDFALFGEERRPEAMREAKERMNDYKHIKATQKKRAVGYAQSTAVSSLRPAHTAERHARSVAFLETTLAQPFAGPSVVVTHHLPHLRSIPQRFAEHLGSAAYASDLSSLIEKYQPNLWVHGHSHDSADYQIGGTRIVCNPRGYPQRDGSAENPNFNAELVIEL